MHTELIKHQIAAYQEREAEQRSEALAQAAAGNYSTSTEYLRAADWTALKIAELQRRLEVQEFAQATAPSRGAPAWQVHRCMNYHVQAERVETDAARLSPRTHQTN